MFVNHVNHRIQCATTKAECIVCTPFMIFVYILIGLSAKSHHHDAAASSSYTAISMIWRALASTQLLCCCLRSSRFRPCVYIARPTVAACPLLSVVFVFPQGKEAAAASADLEIFWAHDTLVDTSQWNLKHIVFYFNVVLLYFTWGYSKVKSKCYLFILAYLFTSTF